MQLNSSMGITQELGGELKLLQNIPTLDVGLELRELKVIRAELTTI